MATPEAVQTHYEAMQRLQVATLAVTRAAWSRMTAAPEESWPAVSADLVTLLSAAQIAASEQGAGYVAGALADLNIDIAPEAAPVPRSLAGVASDGRALPALLDGALYVTSAALVDKQPAAAALALGGRWLDMVTRTQVTDAAREAAGLAITVRPRVGWVRMVNPPCCGRCAIQAGKWFRYNAGFKRHPRCDCVHIPATEDTSRDVRTNPSLLFERRQITDLSAADRQAIDDGADPGQVVNAYRRSQRGGGGMRTAQVFGRDLKITDEGTTRRGQAYRVLRERRQNSVLDVRRPGERYRRTQVPRLMPSSIYEIATDRTDALRLLRLNGFITD